MTRTEYLAQLDAHLRKLPQVDYEEAMAYFREYFDEAGEENEAMVMAELGTPREAARDLINNLMDKKVSADKSPIRSKYQVIWLVILAICTLPIWGGILIGVLGVLLGIVVTILTLTISAGLLSLSAVVVAVFLLWNAFNLMGQSGAITLLGTGGAISLLGGAILLSLMAYYFVTWTIRATKVLVKWLITRGKRA